VKLLLDEMLSRAIAEQLRKRGHDVVSAAEVPRLHTRPDPEVFAAAQSEGRAIVTENAGDFRMLGAAAQLQGVSHAGLIITSNRQFSRHDPRVIGRLVTALDDLLQSNIPLNCTEHWLAP